MSNPTCPWWSEESISEPQSNQAGLCFLHPPEEPPLDTEVLIHQKLRWSSTLSVHWKHLPTKLYSCYTWAHVFGHVPCIWKLEGRKMFMGLWRGEREERDRGHSFSSIRILEPVLQQGQVSLSFSRAHFYAALYLPRDLPTHREHLRPGRGRIKNKLFGTGQRAQ